MNGRALFARALVTLAVGFHSAPGSAADAVRRGFVEFLQETCPHAQTPGARTSGGKLALGAGRVAVYHNFAQQNGDVIRVFDADPMSGERVYELYQRTPKGVRASISARLTAKCAVIEGREVVYDDLGRADHIRRFDRNLEPDGAPEPINPPVPPASDPGGVKVALIDSGVNYLVPAIAQALARDANGKLLGYDFREMDDRPFDIDPLKRGPFVPARHGTSVASVLLGSGGQISLVPYSFPGSDPRRFRQLVEHMRGSGVRIANMSMGSADPASEAAWREIAAAIESAPEILFVVAAGNESRNVDSQPSYPASFRLPNVIVVGAVDASGRLSRLSNYGTRVDVAAVADPIMGRDFGWNAKRLYGTSFAAPRVAALAAQILRTNPEVTAPALKSRLCAMARPLAGPHEIACGYIG